MRDLSSSAGVGGCAFTTSRCVSHLPLPDYGSLGSVRARDQRRTGQPSVGELLHYNVDGVGADGLQLHAWAFGVLQRAMATGHRWTLVEMPRRAGGEATERREVEDTSQTMPTIRRTRSSRSMS